MSKGNTVDTPSFDEAPPLLKRDWFRLISIMIIVLCVWGGAWWFIDSYINIGSTDTDKFAARGQFGDKFGAVNALFAGLAFAGIIFTIFLQSREIKQTKTMLEEQLKDSNKQRFDSTFFQLLNLHNEITSKLSDTENKGREAFSSFHDRVILSDRDYSCYAALQKLERDEIFRIKASSLIEDSIKAKLNNADISNIETSLEENTASIESFLDNTLISHETKIKNAYTVAAEIHVDKYSHYFRNLYHTLKFIKESPLIDESERAQYSKYLRSQLTEPELICLFYNSLTKIELPGREDMELGYPKMGKLLRHYDILQNLPPRRLLHPTHLTIFKTRNTGI